MQPRPTSAKDGATTAAGRVKERSYPGSQGQWSCRHLDSALQDCEKIQFCCFKPLGCGSSLWQPGKHTRCVSAATSSSSLPPLDGPSRDCCGKPRWGEYGLWALTDRFSHRGAVSWLGNLASHLFSQGLSFLIYTMGILITPSHTLGTATQTALLTCRR